MTVLTLNLDAIHLTDDQFFELCQHNQDLRLERNCKGELIIMAPVGAEGGSQEADYIGDLIIWNRQTNLGRVFSSSTGFTLPNGSVRSPDAAWIERSRWEALTLTQRKKFAPIAPDFVIELRSETDELKMLQDKMQEYLENGVRLGWLINPQDQQVDVYRLNQDVQKLGLPIDLSGEAVLPGFVLSVERFSS
ncbi:Uma2 family endonuclease [Phormidesmis sp. 146-12]